MFSTKLARVLQLYFLRQAVGSPYNDLRSVFRPDVLDHRLPR